MITISKPKLLAFIIIILSVTVGWEGYLVIATPAPTIGRVVTPGDLGPCDYFVYLDGTTPVALFESHKGGTPGDNIIGTAGQDIATFLNPITTSGAEICLSGQSFNIGSTWILQASVTILGNFNTTTFIATANNFDVIGINHPACGGTPIRNMIVSGLGFKANGHTGLNALNFNQSLNEVSANNIIQQIWVDGTFNYIAIMDGNEASPLRDVYVGNSGSGDISYKVFNGASEIINVQYMNPAGTGNKIHISGSQFLIDQSTFDSITFENQVGGANGGSCSNRISTGSVMISNSFIANADPGAVSRFTGAIGQSNTVFYLALVNDQIESNSGGAVFAATGVGTGFTISRLDVRDSFFLTGGAGTGKWVINTATGGGGLTIGYAHWATNYVAGTFIVGDFVGSGNGNYYFQPQPAGFGETCPVCSGAGLALPVGTGSANKRTNPFGWPVIITWSNATAVTPHIIDQNSVDKQVLGASYSCKLNPAESIYYATSVPTAWQWYGDEW